METINTNQTVRNTGIATGIGALALATKEAVVQKRILANPDKYIREAEAKVAKEARFKTPFFMGTEEASKAALEQLQNGLEKFKSFAKGGKLNFKAIGKMSAIGAGIGACAVLGYQLIRKLIVNLGVENTKIARDIVTNNEANKAIKDIKDAVGPAQVEITQ